MFRRELLAWILGVTLGVGLLGEARAGAQADSAPRAIVQRTVDRVLAVLRDPKLSGPDQRKARAQQVRAVVSEVFDWEDMARRSLGVHWRTIDDAQRKRFVESFQELLANRYMEDINRFRGDEQVLVQESHQEGDTYRVDTTVVTHSRERVPISYFLHADGHGFRIHDFSIEGVSLVNHYRKSFDRFLVNGDIESLLRKLGEKR